MAGERRKGEDKTNRKSLGGPQRATDLGSPPLSRSIRSYSGIPLQLVSNRRRDQQDERPATPIARLPRLAGLLQSLGYRAFASLLPRSPFDRGRSCHFLLRRTLPCCNTFCFVIYLLVLNFYLFTEYLGLILPCSRPFPSFCSIPHTSVLLSSTRSKRNRRYDDEGLRSGRADSEHQNPELPPIGSATLECCTGQTATTRLLPRPCGAVAPVRRYIVCMCGTLVSSCSS